MFCDADDFVSPQLVSVVTRAVDVFGEPDMMIYGLCTELPAKGWPVYDVEAMSEADGRFCTAEEVCFRIFTDPMTRGYSCNKAVKRELALSARYDEDLSVHEDECYILEMLLTNMDSRACYLDYCLYCYVQHNDPRLTRSLYMVGDKDIYFNTLASTEKTLSLPGLPDKVKEQVEGLMYHYALNAMFGSEQAKNPEARLKLKSYIRKYFWKYYVSSQAHSVSKKAKTFLKHILVLLHIHKPRRK